MNYRKHAFWQISIFSMIYLILTDTLKGNKHMKEEQKINFFLTVCLGHLEAIWKPCVKILKNLEIILKKHKKLKKKYSKTFPIF